MNVLYAHQLIILENLHENLPDYYYSEQEQGCISQSTI